MKIFTGGTWGSKVNFVDENNVMLGYDLDQACCENADWFIEDAPTENRQDRDTDSPDLEGFVFDPEYFKEVQGGDFDEGGAAIFRIVKGDAEKFIHIFNSHKGYYCHDFEFKAGDKIIRDGGL